MSSDNIDTLINQAIDKKLAKNNKKLNRRQRRNLSKIVKGAIIERISIPK